MSTLSLALSFFATGLPVTCPDNGEATSARVTSSSRLSILFRPPQSHTASLALSGSGSFDPPPNGVALVEAAGTAPASRSQIIHAGLRACRNRSAGACTQSRENPMTFATGFPPIRRYLEVTAAAAARPAGHRLTTAGTGRCRPWHWCRRCCRSSRCQRAASRGPGPEQCCR